MTSQARTFLDDRSGASAPEYALVLAGMAAAVVVGLSVFGSTIGNALMASGHYIDQLALNFGPSQTASASGDPSPGQGASARPAPAAVGRNAGSHGRGAGWPGQSLDAPGHGGSTPGKSETAPGKNK